MTLYRGDSKLIGRFYTEKGIKLQITDWNSFDLLNEDDLANFNETQQNEKNVTRKYIRRHSCCKDYTIQIFGCTEDGKSVGISINDFQPYFFVKLSRKDLEKYPNFKKNLVNKFKEIVKTSDGSFHADDLVKFQIVKRKKFFGFTNEKDYFFMVLQFRCKQGMMIYKNMLEKTPIRLIGIDKIFKFKNKLYEADLDPMLRFMHLQNINPSGWIILNENEYVKDHDILCNCNINVKAKWNKINMLENSQIGPIRILSFDIECTSGDGTFPQEERRADKVIQIGSTCHLYGQTECCFKHIVTLGKATNVDKDVIVECVNNEKDLLITWAKLIQRYDPDIITGYNIFGFDWKYMFNRAKIGMGNDMNDYSEEFLGLLSKSSKRNAYYREKSLSSSALGDNFLRYVEIPGRVQIDLMKLMQKDFKFENYKLDNVAKELLGHRKIDLKPSQIFEKFIGGKSDEIGEIANYCIRDCELCNRLIIKLETIANNIGMSNVCIIPLSYLFLRGQGIKIFSLVAKQCQKEKYLIRTLEKTNNVTSYEGAIVFDPIPDIYLNPICILDYSSLYPSSMIAENLSHDTIVTKEKYLNLPGYTYNKVTYDIFEGTGDEKHKTGEVKECIYAEKKDKKGILPRILQHLLKARKDTRTKMIYHTVTVKDTTNSQNKTYIGIVNENKTENTVTIIQENKTKVVVNKDDVLENKETYNEFEIAILEGLQLAYKVTANSLYGQVGSSVSQIFYIEIAASTTAVGRNMVILGRDKIVEQFKGTKSVYGDTDSCFFDFTDYITNNVNANYKNLDDDEKIHICFDVAFEAESYVQQYLKSPHKFEVEKIFYPFIIFAKKRYASNKYEPGNRTRPYKKKRDFMGVALKRRDNAKIVKIIYNEVLDYILDKYDIEGAKQYFKQAVTKLLNGEEELKNLIISKSLKGNYANPNSIAHKVLADRINEREPGNGPKSSDRVPYCFIDSSQLKCFICDKKKLNIKKCKCRACMKLFCERHLENHSKNCIKKCRFCWTTEKIRCCTTCMAWYCEDDMTLHNKRNCKKTNQTYNDKCKTLLDQKLLQGDIIETPEYIKEHGLLIDYRHYLEHQIKTPILQIFSLRMKDPEVLIRNAIRIDDNKKNNNQSLEKWFAPVKIINNNDNND